MREPFRRHGIAYEVSKKVKSDLYRDLLPLVNSRRIDLLDDARLITQLVSLERRTARGGKDSIDHPPGAHDDVGNAVAGAASLATGRTHDYSWVCDDNDKVDWNQTMYAAYIASGGQFRGF